jgi:hypothetical protein
MAIAPRNNDRFAAIRPLRAQGPTGADGSDRADEAIATGERAPDGDARRRRSDGGGR